MGEVVSFPKGDAMTAHSGAELWPLGVPVAGPDEAPAWPDVVEGWVLLLDDILARRDWLLNSELVIWTADAHRLLADLARQPVNIRMASTIATRIIALKIRLDPPSHLHMQGVKDLAEARGRLDGAGIGGGLMSDAQAENERLKGLLQRTACASSGAVCADDFHDPLDDECITPIARGKYPPTAPRRAERRGQCGDALGLEACSVRFHFANLCVALVALLRAGWQWLVAQIVMDDPFAPWGLSDDVVSIHAQPAPSRRALLGDGVRVSHVREGVMRKEADDFLGDEFPAGTPDGAA